MHLNFGVRSGRGDTEIWSIILSFHMPAPARGHLEDQRVDAVGLGYGRSPWNSRARSHCALDRRPLADWIRHQADRQEYEPAAHRPDRDSLHSERRRRAVKHHSGHRDSWLLRRADHQPRGLDCCCRRRHRRRLERVAGELRGWDLPGHPAAVQGR